MSSISDDDSEAGEVFLRYTKASDARTEVCGWLVKQGNRLKKQKPRYLRLNGSLLSNHRNDTSEPSWTVNVLDCAVVPGERKYEFVVNLPKRKVSFFAENAASFEMWIIALKRATSTKVEMETFYKIGTVIGEGVNGEVYQGWDRSTDEPVAIKSVPYGGDMMQMNDPAAEDEIRIVKSLNHPHLVKTYDIFRMPKEMKICIVMEYVAGGELHARVANESGVNLVKEGDAIRVARNILSAVLYLHSRNIVHRDIKLENVLCIDADEQKPIQVKLADFGLSSKLSGRNPCLSSAVGTGFYFAPEIIERKSYGASVDMWACGVLFYITLSGQLPFFGKDYEEYYENVLHQELEFPEEEWGHVSADAKDFIAGLLEKDPEKRLTAAEASQHRWVIDSSVADAVVSRSDDGDVGDELVPKTSMFGRKKKTPSQILSKVRKLESERV